MDFSLFEYCSLFIQGAVGMAIFATFIIYYRQLKVMRSASDAQNILAVVNLLQREDVRSARRIVRQELEGLMFSLWTPEHKTAAALVCSSYDMAAILIKNGLVPADIFIKEWGPSIIHCRDILNDYLVEMRRLKGSSSEYWNDFDLLYEKAKKNT